MRLLVLTRPLAVAIAALMVALAVPAISAEVQRGRSTSTMIGVPWILTRPVSARPKFRGRTRIAGIINSIENRASLQSSSRQPPAAISSMIVASWRTEAASTPVASRISEDGNGAYKSALLFPLNSGCLPTGGHPSSGDG